MSRQNNHSRDRKTEGYKRDAASNETQPARNEKDVRGQSDRQRNTSQVVGLDRYRLNDLYERSSI